MAIVGPGAEDLMRPKPTHRIVKVYDKHYDSWGYQLERRGCFGRWKPISAKIYDTVESAESGLTKHKLEENKKKKEVVKVFYDN
jgi:hypothetical protein